MGTLLVVFFVLLVAFTAVLGYFAADESGAGALAGGVIGLGLALWVTVGAFGIGRESGLNRCDASAAEVVAEWKAANARLDSVAEARDAILDR